MPPSLLEERDGRVLTLTLNRPSVLNALNGDLILALKAAIDKASKDPTIGAIVLTGAGRAFASGADLNELRDRGASNSADLGEDLRRYYVPLIRSMRACPQPILAAINGVAAGAGLSLALACDLRLASAGAQLIVVFVRVGLVPDAGALYFLPRLVGWGKALELALTGEAVTAEEGHRLGLVNQVLAGEAELREAASRRAGQLAAGPAQAHALIKRGLDRSLTLDLEQVLELEAQLQSIAGGTADHREAVQAFLEKRVAAFDRP